MVKLYYDKDVQFSLIELKAYRIGESLPTSKFEIAEILNSFLKLQYEIEQYVNPLFY